MTKICPHCGSENTYLLRGRDVNIKDITVMDKDPNDDSGDDTATMAQVDNAHNGLDISGPME